MYPMQEYIAKKLVKGLAEYPAIPSYMHHGIRQYVVEHRLSGDFLMALLRNDLREAVSRADTNNARALVDWVHLLYNSVPSGCWGSPEAVDEWLSKVEEEDPAGLDTSA